MGFSETEFRVHMVEELKQRLLDPDDPTSADLEPVVALAHLAGEDVARTLITEKLGGNRDETSAILTLAMLQALRARLAC